MKRYEHYKTIAVSLRDRIATVTYEVLTVYSRDHAEAVKAFIEKRKPLFTGK